MGGSMSAPLATLSPAPQRSFFIFSKPSGSGHHAIQSVNRSGDRGFVEEPTVHAPSTNAKQPSKTKAGLKRHDKSRRTSIKKENRSASAKDSTRICLPATEASAAQRLLLSKQPKQTFRQAAKSHNVALFASSSSSQNQAATEGGEKVGLERDRRAKKKPSRSSSLDRSSSSLQASGLPTEARTFKSAPSSAHRATIHPVDRKQVGKTRVELRNPPSGPGMSFWRPSVLATHPPQPQSAVPKAATPYKVSFSNGVKVTMLSDTYKVFVVDLVTKETCDYIIRSTAAHIRRCEKGQGETWRTLYSYTKMDLPCCEIKSVQYHTDRIMRLVAKIIGDVFEERKAAASLHARSWKEPHLLRYQVVEGQPVHRGVELHHDGSHFTWQLMLSDENDYVGGGTYFRCLRKTIRLKKGQALVHPGELYHKGIDIEEGVRDLVVCFMDGFDPQIDDPFNSDGGEGGQNEKQICVV